MRKTTILIAWLVAAGGARGDIINDVQNGGTVQILAIGGMGQTFIAVDPLIGIVSVGVSPINPAFGPPNHVVYLEIYEGQGKGGSLIARHDVFDVPTGHKGWLDFEFAQPVELDVGFIYTIFVNTDTALWGATLDYGGHYLGGFAFPCGGSCDLRFRVLTGPLPGSCCLNGGCLNGVDEGACASIAGEYTGNGTSCADNVCDPHACCTDVGCFSLTESECITRVDWQDWLGETGDCSDCFDVLGACCLVELCIEDQTEDDCLSVSASWAGPLTDCASCPPCDGPDFDGDGAEDNCDTDIDNDGVRNEDDVCDFTPLGLDVQANGTVPADLDGDCNVDLRDYALWQVSLTGP